jgi:threonine synthase
VLSHLACGACATRHEAGRVQTVCRACGQPLLARYDLAAVRARVQREALERGPRSLWRFAPLLPVEREEHRLTLGEGLTPLLPVPHLARDLGLPHLLVKEEGLNPTGTFKARGLCVAVARGIELGVRRFAIPTAGNAGVALAAYAALAGAEAHVFMPRDAPPRVQANARALGAQVELVEGLISDAGKACAAFVAQNPGVLDVSTLKEPYRVEGKKTMGLELAMDMGWRAPDVVVYPAGGGTGIVGIAKAFHELAELGWSDGSAPRLAAIQAEGCAPVVKAFRSGAERCEFWEGASTSAAGLRVPKPFADQLMLRALRESKGTAIAVSEEAIARGVRDLAKDGIFACPEGGAAMAGCRALAEQGWLKPTERVVVFNTGSALAY